MRNGIQALKIWPVVYELLEVSAGCAEPVGRAVADVGRGAPSTGGSISSAKRHIFLGFQKSKKTMVQRREKRPAVMSTRLLSMWLDQKNCMEAKEMPTTRMAGSTSKVSFHGTMARTSQNGTITAVIGRMRPIMAFMSASGRKVTAASMCTGVPIDPHATGAVLAMRLRDRKSTRL